MGATELVVGAVVFVGFAAGGLLAGAELVDNEDGVDPGGLVDPLAVTGAVVFVAGLPAGGSFLGAELVDVEVGVVDAGGLVVAAFVTGAAVFVVVFVAGGSLAGAELVEDLTVGFGAGGPLEEGAALDGAAVGVGALFDVGVAGAEPFAGDTAPTAACVVPTTGFVAVESGPSACALVAPKKTIQASSASVTQTLHRNAASGPGAELTLLGRRRPDQSRIKTNQAYPYLGTSMPFLVVNLFRSDSEVRTRGDRPDGNAARGNPLSRNTAPRPASHQRVSSPVLQSERSPHPQPSK
jgi:hypothetical protein